MNRRRWRRAEYASSSWLSRRAHPWRAARGVYDGQDGCLRMLQLRRSAVSAIEPSRSVASVYDLEMTGLSTLTAVSAMEPSRSVASAYELEMTGLST